MSSVASQHEPPQDTSTESRVPHVKAWTEFLQGKTSKLEAGKFENVFGGQIQLRDQKFGWTATHGMAGGCAKQILQKYFEYLKRVGMVGQLLVKDNDKDIPLQSAINSHAPSAVIRLILTVAPHLTKRMLCSRNKKKETPLKLAFDQRQWDTVKEILRFCIKHEVLGEFTGVRLQRSQSNTLLHRAFKRGHIKYLRVLLEVCKENNLNILPVLVVPDKNKRTPWYHLVNNCNEEEFGGVLSLVQEYSIDVNSLLVDLETKATMLHLVARHDMKGHKQVLIKHGANEEQQDERQLLPIDRCHVIASAAPSSTVNAAHTISASETEESAAPCEAENQHATDIERTYSPVSTPLDQAKQDPVEDTKAQDSSVCHKSPNKWAAIDKPEAAAPTVPLMEEGIVDHSACQDTLSKCVAIDKPQAAVSTVPLAKEDTEPENDSATMYHPEESQCDSHSGDSSLASPDPSERRTHSPFFYGVPATHSETSSLTSSLCSYNSSERYSESPFSSPVHVSGGNHSETSSLASYSSSERRTESPFPHGVHPVHSRSNNNFSVDLSSSESADS